MSTVKNTVPAPSRRIWIILAFGVIYIVWGATYLFVSYAVEEIRPFLMSSVRYMSAGLLLGSVALIFSKWQQVKLREITNAVITGMIMLGAGTGGVAWALQTVDSGFTALMISAEPLVIVLMLWLWDKNPPTPRSLLGIALGMAGIYLLVSQDQIVVNNDHWLGILAIFISMIFWGVGSIYIGRATLPKNRHFSAGLQLFAGGVMAFIISFFLEPHDTSWHELHARTIGSLIFLILFGSILAYSAFTYLLQNVSPEKVATGTYVNPVIALILGWWLKDEFISLESMAAAGIMLLGVFFINSSKNQSIPSVDVEST